MTTKREKSGTLKTSKEILSVEKLGVDYSWFYLFTKSGEQLTVYDVKWIVDESIENSEIMYPHLEESNRENPEYGHREIRKCEIVGNSTQIQNLMASLGYGTPNHASNTIFLSSLNDSIRKLQYAIDDFKELSDKILHDK
ncbi:MAG: hypothetical protein Q8O88_03770 [bacterium]|nr:hypothetical protein [bacterium]